MRLVLGLEGILSWVVVVVGAWAQNDVLGLPVRYLESLDAFWLEPWQLAGFHDVGAWLVRRNGPLGFE